MYRSLERYTTSLPLFPNPPCAPIDRFTRPPLSSAGTLRTARLQLLPPHSAIQPWSAWVYGFLHPLLAQRLPAIQLPRSPPGALLARTSLLPKGLSLSPPCDQHRTRTCEFHSASVALAGFPMPFHSQSANAALLRPRLAALSAQMDSRFHSARSR